VRKLSERCISALGWFVEGGVETGILYRTEGDGTLGPGGGNHCAGVFGYVVGWKWTGPSISGLVVGNRHGNRWASYTIVRNHVSYLPRMTDLPTRTKAVFLMCPYKPSAK